MENRRFIDQAKDLLGQFLMDETITYYLKESGADAENIPSIIETAKAEHAEEEFKKHARLNKIMFGLWLALAVATLVVFMFVLPSSNYAVGNIFILSFLAAALFCVFAFHTIAYYYFLKEENVRKHLKPNIQYPFLPFLAIPGIIVYFIFSARFSSVQEDILKETQVEVTGRVLNGRSVEVKRLRGGAVDVSSITVEFETKEGKRFVVTKSIDAYQLKDFYKGEEIRLIYSKINPNNIDLLADESSIKNFKNTEEREMQPDDLLHLLSVKQENMADSLNKINFGWTFDGDKQVWINQKRQCALSVKGNILRYVEDGISFTYPAILEKEGFKKTAKDNPKDVMHIAPQIYENKEFVIFIEVRIDGMNPHGIVTVTRKQKS